MTENDIEILLVEDNPNDVELTLRAFRERRLTDRIHVARDGQEALDFLLGKSEGAESGARTRPKVILLDLKLPRVDGLQLLKEIKSTPSTRMIPVVALTSSREPKDIAESYELGVNSFISKPIEFEEFVDTLRMLGLYWLALNESPTTAGASD